MADIDDLIAELDGVLTTDNSSSSKPESKFGSTNYYDNSGPRAAATFGARAVPAARNSGRYIKDEDLPNTDDLDALLNEMGGGADNGGARPTLSTRGNSWGTAGSGGSITSQPSSSGQKMNSFERKMQFSSGGAVGDVVVPDRNSGRIAAPISESAPSAPLGGAAGLNSFERKMLMERGNIGADLMAPVGSLVTKTAAPQRNSVPKAPVAVGIGGKKCNPAYAGGTQVSLGHTSGFGDPSSCDQLRCTACDFRVVHMDNYSWTDKVDYLFLRNNTPDVDKLARACVKTKGARALCCQCSWTTARAGEGAVDVARTGAISGNGKWFCSGH